MDPMGHDSFQVFHLASQVFQSCSSPYLAGTWASQIARCLEDPGFPKTEATEKNKKNKVSSVVEAELSWKMSRCFGDDPGPVWLCFFC